MLLCSMLVLSCVEKPETEDPGNQTETPDNPDNPDKPGDPIYPEVHSFNVKAGDTFEIAFETSLEWSVSTDVSWIVITPESGQPGKAAVSCSITGDKPDFKAESKGNVTVKVADKDFVFPVTRAVMERSFRILCAGKDVTAINFDANENISSIELTVEANFYWDLDITKNWPAWITRLGITDGKKGEDGVYRNTFTLSLNDAELDGNDKTGVLTFTDIDDESITFELPVSYTAVVVPEVPFTIECAFGTDIHVNKMGFFKNADGSLSSTMMMTEFKVFTENAGELIVITPTGTRHGEGAGFIQVEQSNKFVIVTKSDTPVEGGQGYTMFVTPGLLESSKSVCDMSYVFVLPKSVYEPYEKFFQANDPDYQMAFMWMKIDNYLFEPMYISKVNPDGIEEQVQANDKNGNLVFVPKEFIKKYMLRVFVDAD